MRQAIDPPSEHPTTQTINTIKWHKTRIVPQVSDTDYGGGIYHGNYFALYNQARDLFLETIGVPYITLMNHGLNLSVAELHTRFHKPVFYGDYIMVHTRIAWVRQQSFGVVQKMICLDTETRKEILKNQVEINLVCTNDEAQAVVLPSILKAAVDAYYYEK